jgi:hypothetical protein
VTDIGEGVDALAVAALLAALARVVARSAALRVAREVAAAPGAALLTFGTAFLGGAEALALGALEPTAGMAALTAVLDIVHQVPAPIGEASRTLDARVRRVPLAAAASARAGVRAVHGACVAAPPAVEVVGIRVDTRPDVSTARLAQAASRSGLRIALTETEAVHAHPARGTRGLARAVPADPIDTRLPLGAGG